MNDTSKEMQERYTRMIMALTPEERLLMAGRMHAAAKELVLIGLRRRYGEMMPLEEKKKLFLAFYEQDFSSEVTERILAEIEEHYTQSKFGT